MVAQLGEVNPNSLLGLDDIDGGDVSQLLARMEARREQEQREIGKGCGLRGRGGQGKYWMQCDNRMRRSSFGVCTYICSSL